MADQRLRRRYGGRDEIRPALERLTGEVERVMRMFAHDPHRHRGFDDGAQPLRLGQIDGLGRHALFQRLARLLPFARGGEMLQNGGAGPGQRRDVLRLGGELVGGVRILAPLRLHMQPAQAEKLGLGLQRHFVKRLGGRGVVAGKLRRLRDEKLGQRLFREQFLGDLRRLFGAREIPRADGDEALREHVESLRLAPLARTAGHAARQPHQRDDERPDDDDRGDEQQKPADRNRNRGFDVLAGEFQRQRPGLVGEPDDAIGGGRERDQKEEQEKHEGRLRLFLAERGDGAAEQFIGGLGRLPTLVQPCAEIAGLRPRRFRQAVELACRRVEVTMGERGQNAVELAVDRLRQRFARGPHLDQLARALQQMLGQRARLGGIPARAISWRWAGKPPAGPGP